MRKTTILIVCIITSTCYLKAQTDLEKPKDKKLTFGLRTGYELQVNDSQLDYKPNLPYIGAFTDIKFGEKWSLQLELNLRSANRDITFSNGAVQSVNERYLTVPILFKYHLNDKFKIYTGTQFLSASLKNDILGIKEWNGVLGVEYNFSKKFFFDARFRHGFEARQRTPTNNFRNNTISIGVGYKF